MIQNIYNLNYQVKFFLFAEIFEQYIHFLWKISEQNLEIVGRKSKVNFVQTFKFRSILPINWSIGKNFDFLSIFRFSIIISILWSIFPFLTKTSVFYLNSNCLVKISILYENFDFLPKFLDENFHFLQKFRLLTKMSIFWS